MFAEGGGDIVWLKKADLVWSVFFVSSSYLSNLFYPKQCILFVSTFDGGYVFLILPTVLTLLLSFQRCLKKKHGGHHISFLWGIFTILKTPMHDFSKKNKTKQKKTFP